MTPSRWERVKDVFEGALSLAPAERPTFLNNECATETVIRAEVERLLAAFDNADNLLHTTALDAPSHTFAPNDVLCDRYRIIGFLGQGGMGEVYEAEDLGLRERIALKTLRLPNVADPRSIVRLRQEVQLARRVTHPNVCRIFDIGMHGEITFLTMELLSGETLGTYLQREHKCAAAQCKALARQMAAALTAAHQAGIIHRDFKPANVMLVRAGTGPPRAVVMDFGVAHSIDPLEPGNTATATGHIVGTPAYMAPEQFFGVSTTAADIYAFGIVLHEMLTGLRPTKNIPSSSLNSRWQRAITKCLEVDPSCRFQTASEVIHAVEDRQVPWSRVVAALSFSFLLLALIITAALAFFPPVRDRAADWIAARRLPQEKNLAILPFVNIGSDPGNQPFCDGLLEVATSTLTQVSPAGASLRVVPSSEVRRQPVRSAEDAYRLFNANLVITGSIQRNGNHVRITANLIDARTKRQLRSQMLDFDSKESIPLQEAVVARLTDLLNLELASGSQEVLARAGTPNSAANELYLRGVGYLQRYDQPGNLDRAISALTRSVAMDDRFTAAYVTLSAAYSRKYQDVKNGALLHFAELHAARALALDPSSAPAHVASGMVQSRIGNHELAIAEFDKALSLDPGNVEATRELAKSDEALGNIDQAEAAYKKAIALRTDDWLSLTDLCVFYNHRRRYPEAAACLERVVKLTPTNWIALRNLGGAYASIPRYQDAEIAFRRSLEIAQTTSTYSSLGTIYIYERRYEEAVTAMERSVALMPADYSIAYIVWANLGDAYRYSPASKQKAPAAYRNAISDIEKNLARAPNNVDLLSRVAVYWAKFGKPEKAMQEIARALHNEPLNPVTNYRAAVIYTMDDKTDRALESLKQAVSHGFPISDVMAEPELERLIQHPQLQDLLHR